MSCTTCELPRQFGVAPRIAAYLDDWQVMVVEYVAGTPLTAETIASVDVITRIVGTLQRLHAGPRFAARFDMPSTIRRWLSTGEDMGIEPPIGLVERMDRVRQAEDALAAGVAASVPCHNDLILENIIDDGSRLWLIDFEYSGNNDPYYEIADVANQWDLDEDGRARLCEEYFGAVDQQRLARMALHTMMSNVGWAIWATIERHISTLPIDYAAIAQAYRDPAVAFLDSEGFDRAVSTVTKGRETA